MREEQRASIRVILVDSVSLMRDGFVTTLEKTAGIDLLAVTDSPRHAVSLAEELAPDIILTEVTLGRQNALEILSQHQDLRAKIIAEVSRCLCRPHVAG